MNKDFASKIRFYRKSGIRINMALLSRISGLSEKYIYNLEREAFIENPDKKNISLLKLRDLILALSIGHRPSYCISLADEYILSEDNCFGDFNEPRLPELKYINTYTLTDLVFSALGLEKYWYDISLGHDEQYYYHIALDFFIRHTNNIKIWEYFPEYTEKQMSLFAVVILSFKIKYVFFLRETQDAVQFSKDLEDKLNFYLLQEQILRESWWNENGFSKYYTIHKVANSTVICSFSIFSTEIENKEIRGLWRVPNDSDLNNSMYIIMSEDIAAGYALMLENIIT